MLRRFFSELVAEQFCEMSHYWWDAEDIFSELVAEQFCEMSHYWWGAEEIFSELVLFAFFVKVKKLIT